MTSIYTLTEQAILCDYFNQERSEILKDIDIYEECTGVYAIKARYSEDFELSNAVARIALKGVEDRLPVWAWINQEGEYVIARTYNPQEERSAELLPIYICMINWADSGPGFSWPEAYYLVWLPEFERYVLTASQDSPDCYGFEDIVIGYAPFTRDRKKICRDLLARWWADQKGNDQEPWACLFGAGFVSEEEAYALRDEVWPEALSDDEGEEL